MSSLRTALNNSQKGKFKSKIYVVFHCIGVSFVDNYVLVYWNEENSVSVVFGEDVQAAALDAGNDCTVTFNAVQYNGKVAAKGELTQFYTVVWCNYWYSLREWSHYLPQV